jgi:hypothetical protein
MKSKSEPAEATRLRENQSNISGQGTVRLVGGKSLSGFLTYNLKDACLHIRGRNGTSSLPMTHVSEIIWK